MIIQAYACDTFNLVKGKRLFFFYDSQFIIIERDKQNKIESYFNTTKKYNNSSLIFLFFFYISLSLNIIINTIIIFFFFYIHQ
jgi:hypothetical protein